MKKSIYKIKEKVFLWGHDVISPWHFIIVPKKQTAQIKKDFGKFSCGWRSLPVLATIGKTTWNTSIFLDGRTDTYLLPLNSKVRKREGIFAGEHVSYRLKILV